MARAFIYLFHFPKIFPQKTKDEREKKSKLSSIRAAYSDNDLYTVHEASSNGR